MWQSISLQLSDVLEHSFTIKEHTTVKGGEICDCFCISDEQEQRFFVKVNNRNFIKLFQSEVDSLQQLTKSNSIQVPRVIHLGRAKEMAFLVLNFLPTKPLNSRTAAQLGDDLAALHLWGDQLEYGFDSDNYIGESIQPNKWRKHWSRFFSEQRIGWQLQLAKERGIEFGDIDSIIERSNEILHGHQPKPALLHGELSKHNVAMTVTGPILYDPASYWGDRECDIAFTELEASLPATFYESYQQAYPLDPNYENRRELYQLYYILNQCNLYGGKYLDKADQYLRNLGLI
ncbi:fructosamine kinase family protein [Vibrio sp. SS-MA-C1-2]|uniref:fructosamine kinase family protein n=1 Tax=Vibrio sp. SS-MA-C1-2 TaxID=2908646 RepID=UPI001F357201|nr:fructosamine kinase family protein [Vibrio sp. SS-MA-C1-2]UJF18314.1 fructosamine kinase family protein [Vibrio sp. SS-MA-C1-2]